MKPMCFGIALLFLLSCSRQPEPASPFALVRPVPEAYQLVSIREVKPEGWIKDQIQGNLDGFVGRLDTLADAYDGRQNLWGEPVKCKH